MIESLKAYNRASQTVGKTRQVVMLYDGAIRFLQQGIEAIEKKDYETRYNKLSRAQEILVGLQACLDLEAGGDVARTLYGFYSNLDMRIFAIHRDNNVAECRAVIQALKDMRDAWDRIDRGEASATPAAPPPEGETVTVSA